MSTDPSSNERSDRPRLYRWLGLRRRQGRWLRVAPTRWGKVLIAMLMLGFMVAMAEFSSHPTFCRTCHIMEPYYEEWLHSSHSDVTCISCHFEPGLRGMIEGKFRAMAKPVKFITGTYGTRPRAEVSDASCLQSGCHDHRLLDGPLTWTVNSSRDDPIDIHFDHAPHLGEMRRGKQLRCVSCHSQIVMGEHISVTVESCHLCHFKDVAHGRDDQTIAGCQSCHAAPQGELRLSTGYFNHADYIDRVSCENCHANTIDGDGAVPRQVCWTCHNQPRQLALIEDVELMHRMHVTDRKVECSACHVKIIHQLDARPASVLHEQPAMANTCGQCHDTPHSAPMDMYRGTGGRGVIDMPSAMQRSRVECIACHQGPKRQPGHAAMVGQTYLATQQACDRCHGSRYPDTLALWQRTIDDHLARAKGVLDKARAVAGNDAKRRDLLADAEHNVRFVELGHGVHNIHYATALLNVAIERCEQVIELAGEEGGP